MIKAALSEMDLKTLSIEECSKLMDQNEDEFPPFITNHILRVYTTQLERGEVLNTEAVCLLFARQILAVQQKVPLEEFISLWNQVCGDFDPDPSLLPGIAVVDGFPKNVVLFDHQTLSDDVEARFTTLFFKRSKWPWEELKAYVRPLYEDEKTIEAVMVKYCRMSTTDGMKFGTSRLPISPF